MSRVPPREPASRTAEFDRSWLRDAPPPSLGFCRRSQIDWSTGYSGVEHIRIEIRTVRPLDRAPLGMDTNLCKLLCVTNRCEDPLELAFDAVLEAQVDAVAPKCSIFD